MDRRDIVWQFVRGDLEVSSFETWLYEHGDLEAFLGRELYMQLIAYNFRTLEDTFQAKKALNVFLRQGPLSCECITLANLSILTMGSNWGEPWEKGCYTAGDKSDKVMSTLTEVVRHPSRWWLSLQKCSVCGQHWLEAQEETIHDNWILERLNDVQAHAILNGSWPSRLDTWKELLEITVQSGLQCRGVGSVWIVSTLKQMHEYKEPALSSADVARLFNVSEEYAREMIALSESPESF